ncbi:hypothetical protein ACSVDA_00230 [Cytobacillus sp. Hm23]
MLENIQLVEEASILDIGCGGSKTVQLLPKIIANGTVYGIDCAEQAVKESIKANNGDIAKKKVSYIKQLFMNCYFHINHLIR